MEPEVPHEPTRPENFNYLIFDLIADAYIAGRITLEEMVARFIVTTGVEMIVEEQ